VNDENDLDTVTAVSGSGPAYYFLLMQAMEEAAQALGLEPKIARLLIQQTALGAAKVALELASSPEQLRQQVSSPGGTTERAIKVFEQGDFTSLVLKALQAAKKRSIELSAELGGS
jgi:pyrroline-5-carboxylate reductase